MSERPKVQHSKCCVVSQPPWVQIPALPPLPPGPIGAGRFCYARMGVSACECCVLLLVGPRVFWAPEGPAAREARASLRSAPRLEARPCPPVPPAPSTPVGPGRCCLVRCVVSKPGQAPPPPTGTAAAPSGTLCTSRVGSLMCGSARRLDARPGLVPQSALYPQFRMQFPHACSL